nr:methyltransferase domain-containing protein [Rhizobium sp. BK399]
MQRRRERLLADWTPKGKRGVEIGPLSRPVVRRHEAEVYYVDHCTTEELVRKYEGHEQVAEMEKIDFVWRDQTLVEMLGAKAPLDFIVAAHVIEHVPDLRGWLGEMHDALQIGGRLLLIVPDKRFTFDIFRRLSPFEEVIQAHSERRRRPGLRVVMDHFANVTRADTWKLWDNYSWADHAPYFHDDSFLPHAMEKWQDGEYVDVHAWVFTPWHFMHLMDRMTSEMGLKFDLCYFLTTQDHDLEFYVQLERSDQVCTDFAVEEARARSVSPWPIGSPRAVADGLVNCGALPRVGKRNFAIAALAKLKSSLLSRIEL